MAKKDEPMGDNFSDEDLNSDAEAVEIEKRFLDPVYPILLGYRMGEVRHLEKLALNIEREIKTDLGFLNRVAKRLKSYGVPSGKYLPVSKEKKYASDRFMPLDCIISYCLMGEDIINRMLDIEQNGERCGAVVVESRFLDSNGNDLSGGDLLSIIRGELVYAFSHKPEDLGADVRVFKSFDEAASFAGGYLSQDHPLGDFLDLAFRADDEDGEKLRIPMGDPYNPYSAYLDNVRYFFGKKAVHPPLVLLCDSDEEMTERTYDPLVHKLDKRDQGGLPWEIRLMRYLVSERVLPEYYVEKAIAAHPQLKNAIKRKA